MIDPTTSLLPAMVVAGLGSLSLSYVATRLSNELAARCSLSIAFAAGVFVGATLLRGELSYPDKYWHWLAYLAPLIGGLGPYTVNLALRLRCAVWLPLGLLAAWLLVPTWETLVPSPAVWVLILSIYFVVTAVLYQQAAIVVDGREMFFSLIVTSAAIAATTAACVSLKYGELAGTVCAALIGCGLVFQFSNARKEPMNGMIPAAALLIAATAFIGCVYPQPAIHELLLLPAAPLSLWAAHSLRGADTWQHALIRIGTFVLVVTVVAAMAVLT